jgi:hypothetical protein
LRQGTARRVMQQSDKRGNMTSDRSVNSPAWQYIPGLLELVEQGVEPDDLATREFVSPQFRSAGIADGSPTQLERSKLERMWNWLRGFRRDATLCERAPIWAPLVEVWAAPQGKAEFTYAIATEQELRAEITVFSAAGLGGASKRRLFSAVKLTAGSSGVAYDTRAFISVHRYTRASTGEVLHRVDVDCAGGVDEFQPRDLAPERHPFAAGAPTEAQLRATDYLVSRLERCSERCESTEVKLEDETIASWKFEVASTIPSIALPFKLGVMCQNTRSFEGKFWLPGGCDYAFCAKRGERPLVPLCIALAKG